MYLSNLCYVRAILVKTTKFCNYTKAMGDICEKMDCALRTCIRYSLIVTHKFNETLKGNLFLYCILKGHSAYLAREIFEVL